jgi:hypothetical protein
MQKRHLIKLLGLTVLAAISAMAVSATVAQAKFLLLLEGKSVAKINSSLIGLKGRMKAENGLTLECQGGKGEATAESVESGAKVTISVSGTIEGCVWVGSEKTCTINDGGKGLIHSAGTGEVVMPSEGLYIMSIGSSHLASVFTEGVFCTIPEEEEISGTTHLHIEGKLPEGKLLLGNELALNEKLGNSKVTELTGEVHVQCRDNPSAVIGLHWVP